MDRFSPNFERHREMGFTRVEPIRAYAHLVPMTEEQVRRAAYFFTYDHPDREAALGWGAPLIALGHDWRAKAKGRTNGRLALLPHLDGGWILVDERAGRVPRHARPSVAEEALLLACDAPASRARALTAAARHVPDADPASLEPLLRRLVEEDVIAEAGENLVTLALLPEGFTVNGLARAG
jgi:hypothetical protein